MLTVDAYFGPRLNHPELTDALRENAQLLVERVNVLLEAARELRVYSPRVDPDTGTCVSGSKGNSGDGGWRPSDSKTGGPSSKHRTAHAVDIFDPVDALDTWLDDDTLYAYGLYRERASDTPGWCHLQDVAPGSGHRTFIP